MQFVAVPAHRDAHGEARCYGGHVDVNEGKHAEVWTESVYEEQVSLLFFSARPRKYIIRQKDSHKLQVPLVLDRGE